MLEVCFLPTSKLVCSTKPLHVQTTKAKDLWLLTTRFRGRPWNGLVVTGIDDTNKKAESECVQVFLRENVIPI